jgi:ribonuclease HII
MIAGIDEAGRSPVLGPLIIACVVGENEDFKRIGCKDSKILNQNQRAILASQIRKIAKQIILSKISPSKIDRAVSKHQLNILEAKEMAKLILKIKEPVEKIFIHPCDVDSERFKNYIWTFLYDFQHLKINYENLIVERNADSEIPIVSAASIIATHTRTQIMKRLDKKYSCGFGEPPHPKTKEFIKKAIETGQGLNIIRKSWKTYKRIRGELNEERSLCN